MSGRGGVTGQWTALTVHDPDTGAQIGEVELGDTSTAIAATVRFGQLTDPITRKHVDLSKVEQKTFVLLEVTKARWTDGTG